MKIYTSSVMEYVDDFDAVNADKPQSYDIDAIKLLYGLSTTRPTDKFCNDSGVAVDPDCTTFDRLMTRTPRPILMTTCSSRRTTWTGPARCRRTRR